MNFDAVALKHTCCIEIDDAYYPNNQAQGKDHDELTEFLMNKN
jgi:hypothetical protein